MNACILQPQRCRIFRRFLVSAVFCVLSMEQAPLQAKTLKQVKGRERVLHALNRFTFGPRPGEVEAVQSIGLKAWWDRQLNPAAIDDSALNSRLVGFPAMMLSQRELLERFPPPSVLRAGEKQGLPLPPDPVQSVIRADQMAFYRMAQEKKEEKKQGVQMDQPVADGPEKLYSGLEAVKVVNLPPEDRMNRILAMFPNDVVKFYTSLDKGELAGMMEGLNAQQKEILTSLRGSERMVSGELVQSRLLRDVYSARQLEAVMTDFWLNHFNIYARKDEYEPYLLPTFEREVVRANALGNFETLLVATAKSPAMLMYLDNWQSTGPDSQAAQKATRALERKPEAVTKGRPIGLNENYARELMELHTLGVNGGYTQADVTQVAKVFSGWTIDRPLRGGTYTFEANRHEPGSKQVLGQTIPEAGEAEGLQVLHLLATSPATARFICTKLAVRFVSDDPPPALVERMAKMFLRSHGDIKAVLRTLFDSREFWSPQVYRAKVKTPLEFVVSAARATGAEVDNAQPLVQSLDKLGMPLYGMQTPNGYSWKGEPWISTGALVGRMNFAMQLASDKVPGTRIGLASLLMARPTGVHLASHTDTTDPAKEQRLELLLLGQPCSDRTRASVLGQVDAMRTQEQAEKSFPIRATDLEQMGNQLPGGRVDAPGVPARKPAVVQDRETAAMAGLLLGSPEFQRR